MATLALCRIPLLAAAFVLLFVLGCSRNPRTRRPGPDRDAPIARPLEVYRQLGLLAGPEEYPVVASFATLAGPADSSYVLFGLSLPNSALRFQRSGGGFAADYTVALAFMRDSQVVRRIERRESVRVPSFAETARTDESVVFQALVVLPPGKYSVEIKTGDGLSGRGFEGKDTLEVPRYGSSGRVIASPVIVYRASGRSSVEVEPELIVNPRHTVPYGGDAPKLYIESYATTTEPLQVRVLDEENNTIWESAAALDQGAGAVRFALLDIPPASLPLGRLAIEVAGPAPASAPQRTPLLVTISDQWMVANFDEVLQFLEYIALTEELDSLRQSSGGERRALWDRFWARRDPVPATPINEYREAFFERVRIATLQFSEPGRQGWQTDRGEVFIVLGTPDLAQPRHVGRTETATPANAVEWIYEDAPGGRLELLFVDRTGFGRYELTPSSRSAFRSAATRLRPAR